MVERRCRLGLVHKSRLVGVPVQDLRGEELQGDGAVELRVMSFVNNAHATLAEFVQYAVMCDALLGHLHLNKRGLLKSLRT